MTLQDYDRDDQRREWRRVGSGSEWHALENSPSFEVLGQQHITSAATLYYN